MYCDNSVRYVAFMGTPCPGGRGPIGSCLKGSFPLYCLLLLFFLLHVAHILLTFVVCSLTVHGTTCCCRQGLLILELQDCCFVFCFLEGGDVFILFSFLKIDTSLESKEQNFPELLLL